MSRTFTKEEIAKHNTEKDCWVIINGSVFDVTKFLALHPGGKKILLSVGGTDASKQFAEFHKASVLEKYKEKLYIGTVESSAEHKKEAGAKIQKVFGDLTPFAEPAWYQGYNSHYYNESHHRMRKLFRDFVEKEIMPYVFEWEESKQPPMDLHRKYAEIGVLQGIAGKWPVEYTTVLPLGLSHPDELDMFHRLIQIDELSRCACLGLTTFLGFNGIGLPPISHFGSKYLKDKVMPSVLAGQKRICLAITEPSAGSDVGNIKTSAKKTPDGLHYIVNGEKKWISGGIYSDYFTVAVRTGDKGMSGISLLLLEKDMPGLKTRRMDCSGLWCSGTTYLTFEDVMVPVENIIGKENHGFKYIMYNFNTERWGIIIQACRLARICFESAFKYASKRKAFGQKLIENPLIRNKLGNMIRQIEATFAWLEMITYQMQIMPLEESRMKLGPQMALLKAQASTTLEYCSKEAVQIFGGLGFTRGGQGEQVERIYRENRAIAIFGGSEEVMIDFAVRATSMMRSKQ